MPASADMTPASGEPRQQTCPPVQSEPLEHWVESPVHVPSGTQEEDGGKATVVQHVWPEGQVPPPPPASWPMAPQVPMRPSGLFASPPSSVEVVLASAGPPGAVDDELHAVANPRTRYAPRENRTNAMGISGGRAIANSFKASLISLSPGGRCWEAKRSQE